MKKINKSQLIILPLLTILLIIAPLLSSSLRLTYIYFITNLLIIVLGVEAGLLSFLAKPSSSYKDYSKTHELDKRVVPNGSEIESSDHKTKPRVVEKSLSEKIVGSVKVGERVKKCPSMPSLFFIGGGDNNNEGDSTTFGDENYYFEEELFDDIDDIEEEEEEEEEEEKEVVGGDNISGQELFAKAENFIGNFYKQLKMQREESWKRIHGFYQRAF